MAVFFTFASIHFAFRSVAFITGGELLEIRFFWPVQAILIITLCIYVFLNKSYEAYNGGHGQSKAEGPNN
jgi:hypothetical protein